MDQLRGLTRGRQSLQFPTTQAEDTQPSIKVWENVAPTSQNIITVLQCEGSG